MSTMTDRLTSLISAISYELRDLRTQAFGTPTGTAAALDTSANNLVGAINEVRSSVDPTIYEVTTATYTLISSPAILVYVDGTAAAPQSVTIGSHKRFSIVIDQIDPTAAPISVGTASDKFNAASGPFVISDSTHRRFDFEYINASVGYTVAKHAF